MTDVSDIADACHSVECEIHQYLLTPTANDPTCVSQTPRL